MRFGLFSDVHANLEALEIVLDFFQKNSIGYYIFCGDIVGYGPNPNECIEIISSIEKILFVGGNHDYASSGYKEIKWFNEAAQESLLWTRKELKQHYLMFLTQMPKIIVEKGVTIVHGSPRDPIEEYLISKINFISSLVYFNTQICFVGHTHVPVIFKHEPQKVSEFVMPEPCQPIKLDLDHRYIINVGSVGQPRDGDPRTGCAIYDTDTSDITFFRMEYDVKKTQDKMRKANLSNYLVERLTIGA